MHTHQPKWSDKPLYYYTDYVTYRKIKALKRWYWQTVREFARWRAWNRKTVYKAPKEPTYYPGFVNVSQGGVVKRRYLIPGDIFQTWYRNARMPNAEPVTPYNEMTVSNINYLYEEAKAWYMEHRGEPDPLADIAELKPT